MGAGKRFREVLIMDGSRKVSSEEAGERLDKWLCRKTPGLSRKQVKAALDSGKVFVNSRRIVIAGWELEDGDEVELRAPRDFLDRVEAGVADAEAGAAAPQGQGARRDEVRQHASHRGVNASLERHLARRKHAHKKAYKRDAGREEASSTRIKVYYEDRDVIVVEKPGGLLSVPSDKRDDRDSMMDRVRAYLRRRYRHGKSSFVQPLHRLDSETSGIMIFALSKAGQSLSSQFRSHSVQRSYEAIVYGRVETENGVIDRPLEKGDFGGGQKVRDAGEGSGKRAVTEYRVKERYRNATLLDVSVRTGRTHQIRVHFASEGFPIVGDSLYAKEYMDRYPELSDEVDRTLGFRRHALHAATLGFKHPASGKKMSYRSPMPEDMKALLDSLRTG
jgi:23S rRNA pseudouridine1911/1915/1917 synthase